MHQLVRQISLGLALTFCTFSLGLSSNGKIRKGDWTGASSFLFSTAFVQNTSPIIQLDVASQYFVADRFSLGPILSFQKNSSGPETSQLGVSAQYFFWTYGYIASYIGGSYAFRLGNFGPNQLTGSLGLNVFLSESVAIGPKAVFRNLSYINNNSVSYLDMSFSFSFYW